MTTKVLVIHGPNLNLLGRREPQVYGSTTLEEINLQLLCEAEKAGVELETFQSNHEGAIVDCIQRAFRRIDLIIINAAAFTHYSYAIRDAVAAVHIPTIEVHVSNIYQREDFRHHSVLAPVVSGQVTGLGVIGYVLALQGGLNLLVRKKE